MTTDNSMALWAKCSDDACGHTWEAAFYPGSMTEVARAAKNNSTCPKCGAAGVIAKQKDGVLMEGTA